MAQKQKILAFLLSLVLVVEICGTTITLKAADLQSSDATTIQETLNQEDNTPEIIERSNDIEQQIQSERSQTDITEDSSELTDRSITENVEDPSGATGHESEDSSELTDRSLTENAEESPKLAISKPDNYVADKKATLIYGNKDLADEDAYVLLIMGDGFTKNQQGEFLKKTKKAAKNIMKTSPWNEFKDTIKIYSLRIVSHESGATGESAESEEEVENNIKDTFFHSTFWTYGIQRALTIPNKSALQKLAKKYVPSVDQEIVFVNSKTYGATGGTFSVVSLQDGYIEATLHELAHSVAGLSDEYFAEIGQYEAPNLTRTSDYAKIKWWRFLGKNGVGIYEFHNKGREWFRPVEHCKMSVNNADYCEVCKEQIRKSVCHSSNVTKMFFQTYSDVFYADGTPKDMTKYFILRRGSEEITGDQLENGLSLTYKDANGNILTNLPVEIGTYKVTAEFSGNDTFAPCKQTAKFKIVPEYLPQAQLDRNIKAWNAKKAIKVSWGSVNGAAGYEVYGARCGQPYQYIKTASHCPVRIKKINGKKINPKYKYKFVAKAFRLNPNGEKEYMNTSAPVYLVRKNNKKYTNVRRVELKQEKIQLTPGASKMLHPTSILQDDTKKIIEAPGEFRYFSSNQAIATVNSFGKVTAHAEGKCLIHVLAPNGKKIVVHIVVD